MTETYNKKVQDFATHGYFNIQLQFENFGKINDIQFRFEVLRKSECGCVIMYI